MYRSPGCIGMSFLSLFTQLPSFNLFVYFPQRLQKKPISGDTDFYLVIFSLGVKVDLTSQIYRKIGNCCDAFIFLVLIF